VTVSSTTFADVLRDHRRSYPDQLALVDGDYRATWAQTDERCTRLANALAAAGVGDGDRILWLGQNSFRVYELLGAAAKIGAMVCPGYWRWAPPEMAFAIEDFSPKVIVWQEEEIGATVREARDIVGDGHKAVWLQHDAAGEGSYEGFLAGGATDDPELDVDPQSPLLVIYTAAYTGRQSGSMLSHTNLVAMGRSVAWSGEIDDETVFLNAGPMFHIGNFQFFGIATFLHAGTNVVISRVEPSEVLELLVAERCTRAYLMPVTIHQIVELNEAAGHDLTAMRATFAPQVWAGLVQEDTSRFGRFTGPTGSGYGQTELTGMPVRKEFGHGAIGNAGRPTPGLAIRILNPTDDSECAIGEVGEICAKGDLVHRGYWNRPQINEERFRGGWWHTTDLGRREEDGSVTFVGTMTRMLKTGAENVFPAEVENCLQLHAVVREAAVIGVPNPAMLQDVKAVVVLAEGAEASAATVAELIAHCKENLASYKKPKTIDFIDALPRTAAGGKDYDALDAQFGGGGYPGGANLGAGA
jgi:long-chain acyl-CoA synthetase